MHKTSRTGRGWLGATTLVVALFLAARPSAAQDSTLTVDLPGGVPLELVWIKPGTFTMGLDDKKEQVTISHGFYLGKYEVTRRQWQAVVGTKPPDISFDDGNKPMSEVSYYEISGFMAVLNAAAGKHLYRLPTDAEWEYACRAGTSTKWYFGDTLDLDLLSRYEAVYTRLPDVGSRLPNPWGLYDMGGSVMEFVLDGPREYTGEPQTDPVGPLYGRTAVLRGSSFGHAAYGDFLLYKLSCCGEHSGVVSKSEYWAIWVGFRVLRLADSPTAVDRSSWGQVKAGAAVKAGSKAPSP